MTREIGDILIQEVLDHKDYEVERKIKLIERIEKLVIASLNIASKIMEHKAEVISTEDEAKEMLQNGATVRETQEATGLSYRQTAKISAEVHKQEAISAEDIPAKQTIPTRPTKPITDDNNSDNNSDNGNDNKNDNETDNKTSVAEPNTLEITAKEVQKPDNRTYSEKADALKDFYDPTDPDGTKAEQLITKAEEVLGSDEYKTMCNAYNKPETYQRLCNLWDYFHREIPDNWPERPNIN